MARPTKPESEKRTATLRVRLTPAELEAAVKVATEAGMEFADWVRARLRKGPGRPRKVVKANALGKSTVPPVVAGGEAAEAFGGIERLEGPGLENVGVTPQGEIVKLDQGRPSSVIGTGCQSPPEPSRDPETPDLMTNLEKSLEPARARRTTPGDVDAERTAVEIEEARLADNAAHEAFIERRTRELVGQGNTTMVARRLAAAEWRNRGG